ncbi:MAG TPA: aromatic acid exporter family protein [Acidimicrobiales bacterium]|nr:aromatic acid exporter family protein [Acidimicrobiales bacterium]
MPAQLKPWLAPASVQAAKTAAASGLAWFVAANVIGNQIPVFAPLAALLTVQVSVWESVSRGLQRIAGVVVGVLVAYGFARLAGINAWSVALVIFFGLLIGRAMRLGQQGSVQVPVSALLVLVLGATTSGYALDRVVDTAIGAGFGIVVNLVVFPRTHLAEAEAAVRDFTGALAALLVEMAAQLVPSAAGATDDGANLARARALNSKLGAASGEVQRAATAVRWNPAARRDRPAVERLQAAVIVLSLVERPARGMARSLAEAPPAWSMPAEVAEPLAALLELVASELGAWAAQLRPTADGEDKAPAAPAAPAAPTAPAGRAGDLAHEVLVAARTPAVSTAAAAIASAVAVDARRIHEELQVPLQAPPARSRELSWGTIFGP